jgi:hypothetical protein
MVMVRGEAMHINAVALATQFFYFYLNNLAYFVVSYPNKIYLATANEFVCQKLVEIGKSKDIYLCDRCFMSYFKTFDHIINYKESFVNNKNCQNSI